MICMHSALCHALSFFLLSVCLSVCLLFRTSSITYGNSQARGRIRGAVASLHHSHSNAGSELHLRLTPTVHSTVRSLTHWVRPGMEPASSWILGGFVSAAPQRELLMLLSGFCETAFLFCCNWSTFCFSPFPSLGRAVEKGKQINAFFSSHFCEW